MEKQLGKDEGVTRHDLGREEFLQRVWQWHGKYGTRINEQMRRLGSSLDWQYVGLFYRQNGPVPPPRITPPQHVNRNAVFTMDEPRSTAVTEAFVRLHERGLMYRKRRMVNWCPHLR